MSNVKVTTLGNGLRVAVDEILACERGLRAWLSSPSA